MINSGGIQNLFLGGTSTSATINSGGEQDVHVGCTATGTTIYGLGTEYVYAGGTDIGATIDGGVQYDYGMSISVSIASSEQIVENGGTSTGAMINSGTQQVNMGGTSTGATINSGGELTVETGGTSTGATINSGGHEYVYGTDIGATINGFGYQTVETHGTSTGAMINSGGVQQVNMGGTSTGATINSGGEQDVFGTDIGATIDGGDEHVFSGGSANDVTFSGTHSMLELATPSELTGTISNWQLGDIIDMLSPGVTSVSETGSTLTVVYGSNQTASYTLAGQQSDTMVALQPDGAGGSDLILTPITASVSFISPVIDAAADTAWPVTISGLGDETGTLVFSDTAGGKVSVNITGNGDYLVNLSTLKDGSIASTLSVSDETNNQSVSGGPLTLVGAALPGSSHIQLPPTSTGDLGKVGSDAPSVIDGSQTTNVTFTTGNGPDTIVAGVNDVVHAGTGSDTLVGAKGATLYAGSGPDILYGAPGATLIGGSGPDTFAFEPGFGKNTISNFHASNEIVQFNPAVFASYSAMVSAGAITQSGANTIITDSVGDTATLTGVVASSLTAHNFHFA